MGNMFNEDSDYYEINGLPNESEREGKYLDESKAVYYKKYKKLIKSKRKYIDRHVETHEDNPRLTAMFGKVGKYIVKPHQKMSNEKRAELTEIIECAKDEKPIQKFLTENPFVLTEKMQPAHHGQLCIPKPSLGGLLNPDFLMAGLDSAGFWWYGVELGSPEHHMFTKAGNPTKELSHELRQIEDWRQWLTKHIGYARDELGYMHIDGDLPCYVIIGRRNEEILDKDKLMERQRSVMKRDKDGLLLHHFEWLLDDTSNLVFVR